MGIRIRLPGVFLIVIGVLAILYLFFFREGWTWVEMGVAAVVVVAGAARSLKGS